MLFELRRLLIALVLPPTSLMAFAAVGIALLWLRPRLGRRVVVVAFACLYACSTPLVSGLLMRTLETSSPPLGSNTDAAAADAIVILGGGGYEHAPEYGRTTVGADTLARLRYGAHLYRQVRQPILVAGGEIGAAMRDVLINDLRVPVEWVDDRSRNTLENARYSATMLNAAGIRRVFLVTDAWHIPRASKLFRAMGIEVVPAPTMYESAAPISYRSFMPDARALGNAGRAMKEWLGRLWYALRL